MYYISTVNSENTVRNTGTRGCCVDCAASGRVRLWGKFMVQLITRRGRKNAEGTYVESVRITPLLDESAVQIRVCSGKDSAGVSTAKKTVRVLHDAGQKGSSAVNTGEDFVQRYVISDALEGGLGSRTQDGISQRRYVVSRTQEETRPIRIAVLDQGNVVAQVRTAPDQDIKIPLQGVHMWTPDDPYFYDLEIEFGKDKVTSYFEMR